MSFISGISRLCLILALCGSKVALSSNLDGDIGTATENAQYLLEELRRNVMQITSLHGHSTKTKRDSNYAMHMLKTDFLFDSLLGFCTQIQGFKGTDDERNFTDRQPKSTSGEHNVTRNTTESPMFEEREDGDWYRPKVHPIGVSGLKKGDHLQVTFYVKHDMPARVTRMSGFELEERIVDVKPSETSSLSKETFTVDTSSDCQQDFEIENQFTFESKSNPDSQIVLAINACDHSLFKNKSMATGNVTMESVRDEIINERIALPKFRIDMNKTDGVFTANVVSGRNESVDLTVEVGPQEYLYFHAVFYDRSVKKMVSDHKVYSRYQRGFTGRQDNDNNPKLLSLEVLNNTVVEGESEDEDHHDASYGDKRVRIRVTVFTDSGQRTGKLEIVSSNYLGIHDKNKIVKRIFFKQEFRFKWAQRTSVFPRRKALIQTEERFFCDEEGNMKRKRLDKNCTLSCWAYGRDLTDITISKKDSPVPIYREITHRSLGTLNTVVDVGPASPSIEGTYQCTVTGRKALSLSGELTLFTTGFPQIKVNQSHVTDFGNGTSLVTCVAEGALPLNVTVEVSAGAWDVRLDDRGGAGGVISRNETETETGVILAIQVPTKVLQRPVFGLYCKAASERGKDALYFYLPLVIGNHDSPLH